MIYDIHNWYSAGRFLVLSLKIERLIIVLQLIDLVVADRINIVHELQMKDHVPVIRMKKEKKNSKTKGVNQSVWIWLSFILLHR